MLSSSQRGDFEPNQRSHRSSGGCCETGCGLASFFLFRFRGAGMSCAVPRCCVVRRDASDSSACLHPAHFLAECCGRGVDGWGGCLRCDERSTAAVLVDRCLYGQHSRGERRSRDGSSATASAVGGHEESILKAIVFLAHACVMLKRVGRVVAPTAGAVCALLLSVYALRCQWEQERV
jgi:hypothetical protein